MAHFIIWVSAFSPIHLILCILNDYRQVTLGTNAPFACYTRHSLFSVIHLGCLSLSLAILNQISQWNTYFFFLIDANLFTTGIKTQEMQVWSLGHEDHLEWGFSRYVVSNSCDLMYCSPPGFSLHGISQARILEWVAISFSRGSSPPRNQTRVSSIAGRFFTNWARREGRSPGVGNGNPLSILAWKIPWTEKPGGLQSKGWKRVRRDWATELEHTHNFQVAYVCACYIFPVMSDSLQPYALQSARLLCPWDSLGKNTRVGCYSLL